MATIPFSILRLPEPALHKSIKQMGLMEQFSLSVLSNKTKHAVTMLPAVKNRVSITMTSSLQLDISNEFQIVEFFFKMDPHYQSVEVRQRSNNRSNTSTELSIPGVSVKFWIEHIVHVFCKDQGALLKLENSAGENFDELYDMIANITIVHLEFMCIELQDYHRLKLFPFLKWLTVYGMDMAPISTTILIQNIQGLHLVHEIKWRINDVLISNFSNFIVSAKIFQTRPEPFYETVDKRSYAPPRSIPCNIYPLR
ncbi:F-box domain-containing protein [Caenorhabditis elegans]|uniref:F-box domain-containing protein n=1 Tax=Caenorhabditis elegans TaxID=6239 RepID=Q9TZG5_CAEEL|nr:F-box domain-containing protein [Caenorhabditis elegans]CCD71267.1 F-box domain-containing protein [Caenorhabditis elegans]|eukprot:NP_494040.1 F-box B protein [Caenorhabditis elegans]